ncbi:MFS transporter [Leptolyngbya sp. FACHB-261]|uniref:MFS transporter n=1 Tax=Leptolyngbya sp. FACHB-261 TaxID=2692806 RepID=UPI001686F52D|nr:MFS transporter [Leptolyngbya sp. FACHB-261]MBD2100999.1 MFS transporter [Leptolyngbya sp. FACHB-261]
MAVSHPQDSIWSVYHRATLIGVCLACAILPLDIPIIGVALESIGQELKANFAQLEWVINAYNLTFGAFLLAGGGLADLVGRRRMFRVGMIIFVVLSLLCAFAKSALMLALFRAVQGIGATFLFSGATAVLANEFRDDLRPPAFGMLGSSFGIGLVLGPVLGGVLTSTLGWRWTFLINIPVGFAILWLAVPRMRESRNPDASYVDWSGLFTFTTSLFLLILALLEGPHLEWAHPVVQGSLAGFLIFIGLFVVAERRQQRAMFDLELFRNPVFVGMLILPITLGFGYVALLVYLPLYFQGIAGYAPWQAGLVMLPMNFPVFFLPPLSAQLSLRVQPRKLLATGFICIGLGGLWMRLVAGSTDWKAFVGCLVVVGIGAGIVNGIMDNVAVSMAPSERSGMATGMFNTMRLVGDAVGFAGAGAILISVIQIVLPQLVDPKLGAVGVPMSEVANQVARGDISGAVALVPLTEQTAFLNAAIGTYTAGLQATLAVLAVICFIAAALVLILVRPTAALQKN